MMDLRPYRGADEGALLALWNATLTQDTITPATFRIKILLDPNFSPDGLLVADDGGTMAGFVLSLARQVPLYGQGLEQELGWITAFGVATERRRQGIGRALFAAALGRLAGLGRERVLISPYTPNYFVPGVDVDAYLEVLSSHELMRGGVSGFRYLEYYDALGTVRGCLGGFRKAVALMVPTGSWVQRLGYLPGFGREAGG